MTIAELQAQVKAADAAQLQSERQLELAIDNVNEAKTAFWDGSISITEFQMRGIALTFAINNLAHAKEVYGALSKQYEEAIERRR